MTASPVALTRPESVEPPIDIDIYSNLLLALTAALYPDPLFSIREYVINAVEAKAKKILVKIHNDRLSISDDGIGMTYEELVNALCPGRSIKDMRTYVGWIGIGIYSGVPYCEKLIIITKSINDTDTYAYYAKINAKALYEEAKKTKEEGRPPEKLKELLKKYIIIRSIKIEKLKHGTTIILLKPNDKLKDKDRIKKILQLTVPLPFHEEFPYSKEIDKKICEIPEISIQRVKVIIEHEDGRREELKGMPENYFQFKPPIFFRYVEGPKLKLYGWICLNKVPEVIKDERAYGIYLRKSSGVSVTNPFNPHEQIQSLITTGSVSRTTQLIQWGYGEVYVLEPLILDVTKTKFQPTEETKRFTDKLSEILKILDNFRDRYLSKMESTRKERGVKENIRVILEDIITKIKIDSISFENRVLDKIREKDLHSILKEDYGISIEEVYQNFKNLAKEILRDERNIKNTKFENISKSLKIAKEKIKEVREMVSKLESNACFEASWASQEYKSVETLLKQVEERLLVKCIESFFNGVLEELEREIEKAKNEGRIIGLDRVKLEYSKLKEMSEKMKSMLTEKPDEFVRNIDDFIAQAKDAIKQAKEQTKTEEEENAKKQLEEASQAIDQALKEDRLSKLKEAKMKLEEAEKAFQERDFRKAIKEAQEAISLAKESEVSQQLIPSLISERKTCGTSKDVTSKKEGQKRSLEEKEEPKKEEVNVKEVLVKKLKENDLILNENKVAKIASLIASKLGNKQIEEVVDFVINILRAYEDP